MSGPLRLAALAALLGALAGAASAATIRGTPRADRLVGTPGPDTIFGLGGNDTLLGLGGNDLLDGGAGRDLLAGGSGNDRIAAEGDGARDSIRCGRGADLVNADRIDFVASDCEIVVRQLSTDPFRDPQSQHRTEVEPGSFASGRTVVAVFQSGRFFDGGASGIGFATSNDAGQTWSSGFLPGVTAASTPAGADERASDPSVAYDAVHGVWLAASLGIGLAPGQEWHLLISRSRDGLAWAPPVAAVTGAQGSLDKEWIACDNWPTSPFKGHCYLSFLDLSRRLITTSTSTDGGLTWSTPAGGTPSANDINGAQPIIRPDGRLVVVYVSLTNKAFEENEVLDIQSSDGGVSFSPPARVAVLQVRQVPGLRAPSLPAAGIDQAGRIYVVWEDCGFSSNCSRNDLVLATSADGLSWSDPARVPTTQPGAGIDSLLPGLGADSSSAGGAGHVALVYYLLDGAGSLDVATISSSDGGSTWSRPQRLDAESMRLDWLARTSDGAMVGDYMTLSFAAGRAVPIFALASRPPAPGAFREAIAARTR